MESLGYAVRRQRGSHVRLQLQNARGSWSETVPNHRVLAPGTLRGILRRLSLATDVDIGVLIDRLAAR